MPYKTEWVNNDLAIEHNGVKVYHTYKDDEYDNGLMQCWFLLEEDGMNEDSFDVRDIARALDNPPEEPVDILRQAIDEGVIKDGMTSMELYNKHRTRMH